MAGRTSTPCSSMRCATRARVLRAVPLSQKQYGILTCAALACLMQNSDQVRKISHMSRPRKG
jgi:hypothetical protein